MMKAATTGKKPVKISQRTVAALTPGQTIYDTEIRGFRAACLPSGRVTFGYQYTAAGRNGRRPYMALGLLGEVTAEEARVAAKRHAGKVADGRDPAAERDVKAAKTQNTVNFVLDEWLEKYARDPSDPLRSADAIADIFDRHVRPVIGDVAIYDLRRDEQIKVMFEKVRANGGTKGGGPMANRVHAHLHTAFEWWRDRDTKFITQPLPGKKPAGEKKRDRYLPFDEILDLWRASDELEEPSRQYWKAVLFCGGRRSEVARMHTDEMDRARANWTVPADRYKTDLDHLIPLTPSFKQLLPPIPKNGFVFSTTGGEKPISGFSKMKKTIDKKIAEIRKAEGRSPMRPWQIRDLRRSCRTLMIAIGIPETHAKAVNGHVIAGIDGVYNVWTYRDEKAAAIEKFLAHIMGLLDGGPSPDEGEPANVVSFPKKSAPATARRRRASING
ncbi:integrase arm-type DNA-binding domain-containing protein [Bradyrhizobium sp. Ash2021]|uniref:tyrosine-type recombinase/integrase n=1 Tax=Bradyrhizobium sp. Ash2021 TaxID=2954771 RepID=UPI0028149E67|nr:integrase arm-type DNA-binding domain-containing protein [Bradyrhizobium sp. Ash2021]WMT70928.1 integrase arm-type DNA-binding domain-containing protein [Bradyrhizobium sp. Ash2021]